jgi:hypothetical protein
MSMTDMYEVTLDCHVRFKVKTRAHDHDEAEDNVFTDYENMTFSEFCENYEGEVVGAPEVGSEIVDG